MSDISRLIAQVAKSDMSREALSHWKAFQLPAPNKSIDALVAKLAKAGVRRQPKSRIR